MTNSYWEKVYQGPLENIPWNRTQADYFKHAVDEGKIVGKTALDIGCGMGHKSIYLALHGFEYVTALDISPTAIEYCKTNAAKKNVAKKIDFYASDFLADFEFIQNMKFDFVLDWAALHCIDRPYHQRYLIKLLEHTKPGSHYLLRVFSSADKNIDHFIDQKVGQKNKVCVLQKEEVENLFSPHFSTLEYKTSKPRRHDNLFFIELLMRRK